MLAKYTGPTASKTQPCCQLFKCMEDLTIAETSAAYKVVWREEIDRIIAEQPVESFVDDRKLKETVIELKKAIQDARFKCALLSYPIMTMNMNGYGPTDDQRMLISIITRNFFPSVIFCQEIPARFEKEVVEKCGTGGYKFTCTGKEAAVMWREGDFHGDPIRGTDSSIIKIAERLQRKTSNIDVTETSTRTAMVKLTSRGTSDRTGQPFLAVSWHGRWKNKQSKQSIFDGLICFVHEVCKKEKLSSYIIGGDFNLNTLNVDLKQHGVTVPGHVLSTRDEKKLEASPNRFVPYKDNFVFFPWTRGDIAVSWVRPLEFEDPKDPASDVVEEDHAEFEDQRDKQKERENILDHAPVVGVLKLLPYKKPFKQVKCK